jgi:hypothetical protein
LRSNDACRVISEAMFLYFGDKLDTNGMGLTQADLIAALERHGIRDYSLVQVIRCLELADEGRYAPVGSVNSRSLLQQTLDALAAIDSRWSMV